MPPAPASRPGSRLLADRLNPRPEIIPDQDQPARQPDDVPLGHRPDPWPAWHHQKRTGPSRVGLYTDHLVMHRPRSPNLSMTTPHVTAARRALSPDLLHHSAWCLPSDAGAGPKAWRPWWARCPSMLWANGTAVAARSRLTDRATYAACEEIRWPARAASCGRPMPPARSGWRMI